MNHARREFRFCLSRVFTDRLQSESFNQIGDKMETYDCEVCQDCIMFIANGDEPIDNPDGWSPPKGEWLSGDSDSECNSEFSRAECDACGTTMAGSRHHAILIIRD